MVEKFGAEFDSTIYCSRTNLLSIKIYGRTEKKTGGRSNKYPTFLSYIKTVFKSSLITSFPEIATSKSWLKRIIKIFVFIICVIGFIYQTLNFLSLYFAYPTVVNVLVSNPFEVVQPAITFCNRNRERRSKLCEEIQCTYALKEVYCRNYPRNCPDGAETFTGTPFLDAFTTMNYSWARTRAVAHTVSMIKKCYKIIEGKRIMCEKPYREVPAVSITGSPNMCFTVESLWEKPDEILKVYPNTFTYEIELRTDPEEYVVYTEPILIQVAIHDRRRLVNPYTEGSSLKGGIQYDAFVSMTEKELLPHPYDTNCTDYVKLWKENGGTGPLNELMCIEYCKLQTLLNLGYCIDKNVAYPHNETLCKRNVITTTNDITKNCTKSCESPCRDQNYEIRYEAVDNFDRQCNNEHCRFAKIKLTIHFKRFRVTKFLYQPKFESIEMFSYIGGYMGMWLGLSLVSLFDLFETLCYILYYPVGRLVLTSKTSKTKTFLKQYGKNSYRSTIY